MIKRTFDLLEHCLKNHYREDAVAGNYGKGWVKYSTKEFAEYSELLALALLKMGIKKGDRIATVSGNRPEWNFVDMALSMSGIIHVPVYPTISDEEYRYIFEHAEVRIIFVSDEKLYRRLAPMAAEIKSIESVVTFNEVPETLNINQLYSLGKGNKSEIQPSLEKIKQSIAESDVATMIYTSGTTGTPKGVMLSHRNLVSNFTQHANNYQPGENWRALSFLPLCHIFERSVNYNFHYNGLGVYYVETLAQIVPAIKQVKPHIFCAVPRLLERVYDGILAKGKQLSGIKRKLFFWAVDLGKDFEYNKKFSPAKRLELAIADKLIYSQWRKGLGGNLQIVISGGAALQGLIAKVFAAANIKVIEGYGLTETSPVLAVGNVVTMEVKTGTNGPILPGVEVKIAEDGEILTKGPNLMLGYYKEPELTRQAIDEDGWFHTGDVGYLDEGKYLKITDRKKEIFKLTGGKYIAPQMIENKLKESVLIEQAMVIGDHQKFASALISPNFEYLHECCTENKILFNDNEELINHPKIVTMIQKEVRKINKTLGQHEEIKRFKLVPDIWSPQTGELSQTLKLKRKVVESKYKELIDEIFAGSKED